MEDTRSFPDFVDAKEDEAIVFGWVAFDSHESRYLANKRIAAEPRMTNLIDPLTYPSRMVFMPNGWFLLDSNRSSNQIVVRLDK